MNNSNMSESGVVPKETSSNSNSKSNTTSNSNSDWKKHQRIKPEVTVEFSTFYHFLTFILSLGRNGFRTRPGIDKFRFTKNQVWFPKKIQDKIALGKELAQAMMTIPAIKERFYVRGYFNNAGTPENMSDMDMLEIQVMDLKPNSTKSTTANDSSLEKEVSIAVVSAGVNITDTKISAPRISAPNNSAPKANAKTISSLNTGNAKSGHNQHVANKAIAKKDTGKKATFVEVKSDFPPLKK